MKDRVQVWKRMLLLRPGMQPVVQKPLLWGIHPKRPGGHYLFFLPCIIFSDLGCVVMTFSSYKSAQSCVGHAKLPSDFTPMITSRLSLLIICGFAVALAGCGKKDPAPATSERGGTATEVATEASGRAVEITGNDTMKFSLTEIRAKPGESLSVTLSNVGTMPKMSMGHNWVLLKSADLVNAFVEAGSQSPTTDYIPANLKNDMLAHTRLLGPKEKDTVTFQAPKQPGRYPFVCSFPGHFQVGMKGDLIVE